MIKWTQKNNKIVFPRWEHIFTVYSEEQIVGTLIRIEAESYRRYGWGTNQWDIFDLDAVSFEIRLKIISENGDYNESAIARYDGVNHYIVIEKPVSTPLGEEKEQTRVRIVPVMFANASLMQLKCAATAILCALNEGFGPHGNIKGDHSAMREWAEKI